MWHVTLTMAGDPVDLRVIQAGLEQLSHEHPFLLAARYAVERAELRYWDEAVDAQSAAGMALTLWDRHRSTSALPTWHVVGIEVLDQDTFHRRSRSAPIPPDLVAAGRVLPF